MPLPVRVQSTVAALAAQSVTRLRYGAATIANGILSYAAPSQAAILAQMQPLDDRTRSQLPEGIRLRARYVMHTLADVRGDQPTVSGGPVRGDQIIWSGRTYQVHQDRDWNGQGGYTRMILLDASAEP